MKGLLGDDLSSYILSPKRFHAAAAFGESVSTSAQIVVLIALMQMIANQLRFRLLDLP